MEKPQLGQPIKITVEYRNSGRQPAQTFQYVFQKRFSDSDYINIKKGFDFVMKSQNACKNVVEMQEVGQVVFPTEQNTFYNAFSNSNEEGADRFVTDADLLAGKTVDLVTGCFLYRTFNKTRHTAFSFFYKSDITTDLSHINIYPYSGYAD